MCVRVLRILSHIITPKTRFCNQTSVPPLLVDILVEGSYRLQTMRKMGVTYRTGNMWCQSPRSDCHSLLNHPSSWICSYRQNLCMSNCFQEALTNIQPGGIFEDAKYVMTLYRKVLIAFRSDDVFCLIPVLLNP